MEDMERVEEAAQQGEMSVVQVIYNILFQIYNQLVRMKKLTPIGTKPLKPLITWSFAKSFSVVYMRQHSVRRRLPLANLLRRYGFEKPSAIQQRVILRAVNPPCTLTKFNSYICSGNQADAHGARCHCASSVRYR